MFSQKPRLPVDLTYSIAEQEQTLEYVSTCKRNLTNAYNNNNLRVNKHTRNFMARHYMESHTNMEIWSGYTTQQYLEEVQGNSTAPGLRYFEYFGRISEANYRIQNTRNNKFSMVHSTDSNHAQLTYTSLNHNSSQPRGKPQQMTRRSPAGTNLKLLDNDAIISRPIVIDTHAEIGDTVINFTRILSIESGTDSSQERWCK